MRMDDLVRPTGKVPPPSLTAQTVAEELGWSVSRLLGYIATGQLPPPEVVNGVYRFSLNYALAVRCDGLCLPGTFTGLPPGSPYRQNKKPLVARTVDKNRREREAKRKREKRAAAKKGGAK